MKTYRNLYQKLCSYKNLNLAFEKAKKNKSKIAAIIEFEKDLENNLLQLKKELETFTYRPIKLTRFVIRDPKTRVIRKSDFRDRVIHHAIVNVLDPIYEKIFIYDSYANRINKGTLAAVKRFDKFKRKVSNNGKVVEYAFNDNMVNGYVLKADIKKFFDSVNHDILIKMLKRKIKDNKLLYLIKLIIKNFGNPKAGMPLGNMTSQFFANVYLNDLDYFIKHKLKAKYYIRYADDFVILHQNRKILEMYKDKIEKYLMNLGLELHTNKSNIFPMYKGVNLLGYRIFYYYKLLRKRNLIQFNKRLSELIEYYENGLINYFEVLVKLGGWCAYAIWANTYNLRKITTNSLKNIFKYEKIIFLYWAFKLISKLPKEQKSENADNFN